MLTAIALTGIMVIAEIANFQLTVRMNGMDVQPLIPVLIVLVIIVGVAARAFGQGRNTSYTRPPSMRQLAFLRDVDYDGPMPTSSREAWEIISDIKKRRKRW